MIWTRPVRNAARRIAICAAFALAIFLGSVAVPRAEEPAAAFSADEVAFFEDQVRPILATHCFKCHGGEGAPKAGLRLTSREGILRGGDSGPAVSLEAPGESLL